MKSFSLLFTQISFHELFRYANNHCRDVSFNAFLALKLMFTTERKFQGISTGRGKSKTLPDYLIIRDSRFPYHND